MPDSVFPKPSGVRYLPSIFLQLFSCVPAGLGHWKLPVPGKDLLCTAFLAVCSINHFLTQSICLSVYLSNTLISMFLDPSVVGIGLLSPPGWVYKVCIHT